ncbi:MAG: TatD family deoxyribonuclease [Rikenellaceae bacterium]|nr:TatD family deoxyribonuclease [Rikenellaceae bacterium]
MIVDIHTHNTQTRAQTIDTVGIHPWHATDSDISAIEFAAVAADAIGEIGLDFACDAPHEVQIAIFRAQLAIAERLEKPVVLHCVKAFEEVMRILRNYSLKAVIFHGFIGSKEQAQRAVAQGHYLSFGERTFRSPKTIEALRSTPLSHLFVESDESTTPIEKIYEDIATLQGVPSEQLIERVKDNFYSIFNF